MKPYQFYLVSKFPTLAAGQRIRNEVQFSFISERETVETVVELENPSFEVDLSLLRVRSQIKHSAHGLIKVYEGEERKQVSFTEYLQPVDFQAYINRQKNVLVFQAAREVCRGVLLNLKENKCGIELQEVEIDFHKLMQHCNEYFGAWFKGVSTRVQSAGLTGTQIQNDPTFATFLQKGELSNVTIPWMYAGAEHRVMVTKRGGIVLVDNYKDNIGLELRVVMDVQDKLLEKVWSIKKKQSAVDASEASEPVCSVGAIE